jgi:hypothetical protein
MQATLRQGYEDGNIDYPRKFGVELIPVYSASGEHLLDMDLSGADVFGVQSYGVHLIAYVTTDEGRKYWVPKRALTKTPYPGDLDNTVSSNLLSGQKPFDKVVRRAAEEASIPEEYTRKHAKACGTVFNFRAMTYIDHFVRHGIVNAENEAYLAEVCARLHRKHDLFVV